MQRVQIKGQLQPNITQMVNNSNNNKTIAIT
jgi:hypothetical protein